MSKTVIGIFEDKMDAERAIEELKEHDYNPKDISIVMRDKHEADEVATDTGTNVAGSAATGVATGALLGGLAGLVGTALIPGLGAFFIGGPIAAALGLTGAAAATVSGAATGAVAGGLLGALTGLGLSQEDARMYEERINEGAILLAVPSRSSEENEVVDILKEFNAADTRTVDAPAERKVETREHDREDQEKHHGTVRFAH